MTSYSGYRNVIRNAAIEEAAKACELVGRDWHSDGDQLKAYGAEYLASYIRGLKTVLRSEPSPDIEKEAMRLALKRCAEQFRFYERNHMAKKPPQTDKANANMAMAVLCEAFDVPKQEGVEAGLPRVAEIVEGYTDILSPETAQKVAARIRTLGVAISSPSPTPVQEGGSPWRPVLLASERAELIRRLGDAEFTGQILHIVDELERARAALKAEGGREEALEEAAKTVEAMGDPAGTVGTSSRQVDLNGIAKRIRALKSSSVPRVRGDE